MTCIEYKYYVLVGYLNYATISSMYTKKYVNLHEFSCSFRYGLQIYSIHVYSCISTYRWRIFLFLSV